MIKAALNAILKRSEMPQAKDLERELRLPQRQELRYASVIRGLTPQQLHNALSAANSGDATDFLTMAEELEERDPHYAALLNTRKRAVLGLPRQVISASDDPHDLEMRDAVESFIAGHPSFGTLLSGLLDGLGKGYAVVAYSWDTSSKPWRPRDYVWQDPRYFSYDETGRKLGLRSTTWGKVTELPPYRYLVHEPKLKMGLPMRGGLARFVAMSHVCRQIALENWMSFTESYGAPVRIAKADDRFFPEDAAQRADYIEDLQEKLMTLLGADACAVLPKSVDLELQAGPLGGADVYEKLVLYCEKQISKAVLGRSDAADPTAGQLGMQTMASEVRKDLLDGDAHELSNTINMQLVKPFIDLNFGMQEAYPAIRIMTQRQENLAGLADMLAKLVPLGLQVEQSVVRDYWGLPDPAENAQLLGVPSAAPALNRALNRAGATAEPVQHDFEEQGLAMLERLGGEAAPYLDDWVDRMQELLEKSADLVEFRAGLEGLYPDLDARQFAAIMGQALAAADAAGRLS